MLKIWKGFFFYAGFFCFIVQFLQREWYKSTVSTDKNYSKLMAEISRENGANAFNYTKHYKRVKYLSLGITAFLSSRIVSF